MMTCYVVQEWWLETRIKTYVDLLSIQLFIYFCSKLPHSSTIASVIYILQKCSVS